MKDSPIWTLIQALIVGLFIPIGLAIYNQWQKRDEEHRQEEKDAVDTDKLCSNWEMFGDNIQDSFALFFTAWREGKDLMYPIAAMDLLIKKRPKKRE